MQKRKIILLGAALLLGIGTFVLARAMMAPQSTSTTVAEAPVAAGQVLGAARDLPMGTIIKDADLKWMAWPVEAQGTNLFVQGKSDKPALIGSVVRRGVRMDEPLTTNTVVNSHSEGFLAAVLTPGMRAMSITVSPNGQVAGFIFPGDHVDVILSHAVSRKDNVALTDRHMSETVLTNARVLALDQKSDDQTNDPKIAQLATLEVLPRDAERLALGAQLGTLSLSLRSLAVNDTLPNPSSPDQLSALTTTTDGPQPTTSTWDSDLSSAFPSPGGDDALLHKVQIMRGKDTTESTFERRK
jgi:pilus assembly protein CpaB